MAKTIKFNLICDNTPVRTIEDLQNNFCIEDVLKFYQNGLLKRWLYVRGYSEFLDKVNAITATDQFDIIHSLIRIFDMPIEEEQIRESIYMLAYREERAKRLEEYKKNSQAVTKIVAENLIGYAQMVDDMRQHPNDAARIKAAISAITEMYPTELAMCHTPLFLEFLDTAPLIIMCLLMNPRSRYYYLPIETGNAPFANLQPKAENDVLYQMLCKSMSQSYFEKLGTELRTDNSGNKNHWDKLVPKDKQVMVLCMDEGDLVRSLDDFDTEYTHSDVTNKFILLNGLDYKCSEEDHKLFYMEV